MTDAAEQLTKYPLSMHMLHWLRAVIILGLIWSGWYMTSLPGDTPAATLALPVKEVYLTGSYGCGVNRASNRNPRTSLLHLQYRNEQCFVEPTRFHAVSLGPDDRTRLKSAGRKQDSNRQTNDLSIQGL